MVDKETTPPPQTTETAASSSPVTPGAKRLRMSSPDMTTKKEPEPVANMEKGETQASNNDVTAMEATQAEVANEDDLEAVSFSHSWYIANRRLMVHRMMANLTPPWEPTTRE